HSADPGPNMGGPFGYADQTIEGNLRWAITASLPFARVKGSVHYAASNYNPFDPNGPTIKDPNQTPPLVWYSPSAFDDANFVLMDLTKDISPLRCYYCHSNALVGQSPGDRLVASKDVHILRGLLCTSCHANGIDHQIVRGFEGQFHDPNHCWAAGLTCQGCHLGTISGPLPNIRGPYPAHKGIPAFHFERLSCTACHSGPLPQGKAGLVKTARAHALGTTYAKTDDKALPHIIYPVYARGPDGKIAPHKLIWPTFWAELDDRGNIRPIPIKAVEPLVKRVIKRSMVPSDGNWPAMTDQMLMQVLGIIEKEAGLSGRAAYVSAGKVFTIDQQGQLSTQDHPAAGPVMWVAAHDVRPAKSALGANGCTDCHNNGSAFFFGQVPMDGPLSASGLYLTMAQLQALDIDKIKVLNHGFMFRATLKTIVIIVCGICGLLTLGFAARAIVRCSQVLAEKATEDR
ncbi:MAG: hypothetical protein QHH07_09135, partial [Sedimentisphaerales bacterium]|nr:hypothetical protein [Sedimentisphaerales bacterium]